MLSERMDSHSACSAKKGCWFVTAQAASAQEGATAESSEPYFIICALLRVSNMTNSMPQSLLVPCSVVLASCLSCCATQAAHESVCDAVMSGDEETALGDTQADEAGSFHVSTA